MKNEQSVLDVTQARRLESSELPSFVSRQVLMARRFHFDLSPKTREPLKIVVGGSERLSGEYCYHRTNFPYYSIEFVAEGKGALNLQGKHYDLIPGTIFGFGPDTKITIRASYSQLMLKYHVTFVGHQATRLLKSIGFIPAGVRHVADLHEIREIFDQMIRYGTRRTPYSDALCCSLLPTLVHKIAEQASRNTVDNLQSLATYQRLRDLIDTECQHLMNVKDVAERCGFSVAYICRLFKRYGQRSPHQYLLIQKVKYSTDLLSDTQAKVQEVAHLVGFIDPFHFSRVFKRILGLSPTEFQRHLVPLQTKNRP